MRIKGLISRLLLACVFFTATGYAQCMECNQDCWQNTAIYYSWIFGQRGCMNVGSSEADIDVTPKDVLQNLDLIDFIFQLHLETCKKRWAFMIDPTILAVTSRVSLTTPLPTPRPRSIRLDITSKIKFTLVDFGAYYTAFARYFCDTNRWVKLEVLAGGRNLNQDADIEIAPITRTSSGANWLGAMIGARATAHVYPGLNVWMRGDVSVGSRSHSYGGNAMFGYQFHQNFVLAGGFRILDFCGENGTGDNRFDMDLFYYGPILGLGVVW